MKSSPYLIKKIRYNITTVQYIHYGAGSCGADFINKTIRNSKIRWKEHSTEKDKNSDSMEHLTDNFDHKFKRVCFVPRGKIVYSRRYWRRIA